MPTGKVALVTGANRGIGLQTAKELAARGFHVYLGVRDEDSGKAAKEQIEGDATVLPLDVATSKSIREAAKLFGDGPLHVLVNNAGIYPDKDRSILEIPREQLVETFHTNTFGAIEVVQAFLPNLKKAGQARVINMSSGYGQLDGLAVNVPSYCLSKLALNGVTIMLAKALKEEGIVVNSVCPGWVRTDMGGPHALRSVEEGADTVVWLADEAPLSLTGKFLRDRDEIPW